MSYVKHGLDMYNLWALELPAQYIVLQTMGFDLPISLMWLDPVSLDSAIWSTNVWDDHLKTNFGA